MSNLLEILKVRECRTQPEVLVEDTGQAQLEKREQLWAKICTRDELVAGNRAKAIAERDSQHGKEQLPIKT